MKLLKLMYKLVSWGVVVLTLLIVSVLVLSKMNTPVKVRVFSILSGSMEPELPVGSLVLVKPQSNYEVGDVITVAGERNKEAVTHRIAQINKDEELNKVEYVLKGDANESEDGEPISSRRVIGKVFWSVPKLGKVISFAQSELGFILLIIIPATILVISEAMTLKNEIIKQFKKRQEKDKHEDAPAASAA